MANIEMNYYNGSTYETLYPTSISNLIQLSETLLDRLGLDNGTIDDIISNSSSFVQATTGCIFWYASKTIPEGFLICDGSAVSTTSYSALFAVIGTAFGSQSDSTGYKFKLPDLRAKFIRGAGSSGGYTATFGSTQGATSVVSLSEQNFVGRPYASGYDRSAGSVQGGKLQIIQAEIESLSLYYVRPYNIALTPIIKY